MIKNLRQADNLLGKRVLLRVDFNVPLQNGQVAEDYRIEKTLPTINFLKKQGSKIVILSHIQDKNENNLSLRPVSDFLRRYFPEIIFAQDFDDLGRALENAREGEIIILENLRNWDGEKSCDDAFVKKLASFGDLYVNEAFSASHRKHASIVGLPKILPGFAGLNFEEEIKNLSEAFSPKHPFLFILGGAKTETKIPLLEKFIQTADYVFVGGVLANDFFKAHGFDVGYSSVSEGVEKEIIEFSQNSKIILAQSVISQKNKEKPTKKPIVEVTIEESIKDIVVDDLESLAQILQKSKFILWNGPMGYLEEGFTEGTKQLADLIAQSPAQTILGGGDTISALNKEDLKKFSFVSTGGGAMLDFLANETLPGIEALTQ